MPFELLLLSYVVLGPAHYFTEISWLHDRKYFLPHRSIAARAGRDRRIAALVDHASWFGFAMWGALVICALLAATTAPQGTALMMIAIWLTIVMAMNGSSLAVLGILLPTLIHVSLFTLVFMVLGALKSGSRMQALLVVLYLAAIGLLLAMPPSAATRIPSLRASRTGLFRQCRSGAGRLFGVAT